MIHQRKIDLVHFLARPDSARKSDSQLTAKMLAKIEQAAKNFALSVRRPLVELIGPECKAALVKSSCDRVELRGGEPSFLPCIDRVKEDAGGHRFTMRDAKVGEQLE